MNCVFCQIVNKKSPAHIIWEDDHYLAFLSIYPNTPGTTVVIPKKHQHSYVFEAEDQVLSGLTITAKKVALLLDRTLEGVARTAMIFEGYGVDHLHAKLFPMHGTGSNSSFIKKSSTIETFFLQYEGYVSSHDAARADDSELASLACKIKNKGDRLV